MEITVKKADNKEDWTLVRTNVFLEEQGFTTEFEDIDDTAFHITIYENGKLAGCARMFGDDKDDKVAIFGRIAVLKEFRKRGYGKYLVKLLEEEAISQGFKQVVMSAQCHAKTMYEEIGYEVYGEIVMDEHVEHIGMKKMLG